METSTTNTDPRNISPRSDQFLATIGPYISAIEKYMHDAPHLVKGLNLSQRDKRMSKLIRYFHYAEIDYSRFDMTISEPILADVQDVILTSFFEDCDELMQALVLARHTKGVSDSGLYYEITGTRCSGDAHTSIGNGLINLFNTWILLRDLPKNEWVSYHEGDDGVIAFTHDYNYSDRFNLLNSLGFKVKLFTTTDINQVSFCGRFLSDIDGCTSYCDFYRSMAKLHITLKNSKLPTLLLAKCLSYAHTDGSTPIIGPLVQTIATQLQNNGKANVRKALAIAKYEKMRRYGLDIDYTLKVKLVNEDLRVAFAIRTGISPQSQINLEQYYTHTFQYHIPYNFVPITPCEDVIWETAKSVTHLMPTAHTDYAN